MSSKDKSLYFEKLLNETSNNEDFQSYIKNNHCYTIDILDNTKISKIIDKAKPNMREIAVLSNVVICLFFTVYRIVNMYTDADILQIYPYIPFWRG